MTTPDDNSSPVGSGILAKANRLLRSSSTRSDGNILPLSNRANTSPRSNQFGQGIFGSANDSGSHTATDASYRDTTTSGSGGPPPNEKNEPANPTGIDGLGQNGRAGAAEGDDQGSVVDGKTAKVKRNILVRFYLTTRAILFHSYVNLLLVFVPAGIAVQAVPGVPVGAVFAINSVAIIPLAGLLSHATESVASKLGDTVGALLNVTFGNAVELIIFIALAKDEIRIVQASLLGSILSNLLLILGMCFFLGGLRYREQLYNSTVTQMSACLLSLSVMSLVLPTAFHASFSDTALADSESLKISRGCSVVLLLVYFVYLLFQLKSHAYMYESTPQHIVDAESTPGPAAGWLDTSSSEDSSSSDSDSDSSRSSQHTVRQRMKKVLRGGRSRKSSSSSSDSTGTANTNGKRPTVSDGAGSSRADGEAVVDGSDADEENYENQTRSRRRRRSKGYLRYKQYQRYKQSRKERKQRRKARENLGEEKEEEAASTSAAPAVAGDGEPSSVAAAGLSGETRRVDFAVTEEKRKPSFPPAPLKGVSIKNLAPSVFVQDSDTPAIVPTGPVPRVRYGIRRTNSLPDRLNAPHTNAYRPPGAMLPAHIPLISLTSGAAAEAAQDDEDNFDKLSTVSAVILLLVSTGLVALCAEFVVDSINEVVEQGSVKEAFIGLIILPVVGNAAEHVTAITVAMKNKMDLAIGVAVGSSIQIALFVTPLVVMIGWAMDKEMTLYFTLFETVCLFVSAFIVNFLVLDGRSNYLEGALLMCSYVIIGVIAFYYPNVDETNELGGGA
ncbi:related to manganese resistance protein [Cephalotrichum gorgonifer]|uniref:Related to manganese resistance protein n=1 Tax=Cephalotrichum gorgonifer TaxID=2041049 RepID=A0AAE8SV75_9PEZI|nr:related to manganese resistance protein [Cephalotrichum gorgonifer]